MLSKCSVILIQKIFTLKRPAKLFLLGYLFFISTVNNKKTPQKYTFIHIEPLNVKSSKKERNETRKNFQTFESLTIPFPQGWSHRNLICGQKRSFLFISGGNILTQRTIRSASLNVKVIAYSCCCYKRKRKYDILLKNCMFELWINLDRDVPAPYPYCDLTLTPSRPPIFLVSNDR
jgi:hypothetical protein